MFPHGDWNLSAADKNYSVCPECEDFFFFFLHPSPMPVPSQQLHLNTFPYKASKYEQPIWSNSLKFIGP